MPDVCMTLLMIWRGWDGKDGNDNQPGILQEVSANRAAANRKGFKAIFGGNTGWRTG